jgi:predicted nucleotidyltransferase
MGYNKSNFTIEELHDEDLIIMETIMGSHAYGTATPESDVDIRGVFIQPLEHALKYGWIEQISDEKNDITFYELGRFMQLLQGNNPNILEMIAAPKDCIKIIKPEFEVITSQKEHFLTKRVRWTFAGYAIDQIQKARGYNKKINWEESQLQRKTVLDFCYVILRSGGSKSFKEWLINYNDNHSFYWFGKRKIKSSQFDFGLAAIDHAKDTYALYDEMYYNTRKNAGIVSNEETSNDIQLTSIPKGLKPCSTLVFNKDGYSSHCKKYQEYQDWLKNRNENRFKMNKEHGKNYDSKNMMHTYRLLLMAHEMANGELRVRRTLEEIKKLMSIRKGEYEYNDLLKEAENLIANLDDVFEKSNLPKEVDKEWALDLLLNIRKTHYKL